MLKNDFSNHILFVVRVHYCRIRKFSARIAILPYSNHGFLKKIIITLIVVAIYTKLLKKSMKHAISNSYNNDSML